MISREDLIYLLTAVSAEKDRTKKFVGLRVLALLRRGNPAETGVDALVGNIAHELGHPAGEHARGLLRSAGLV